jgi:cytochrome P450 family 6
MLIFFSLLLSSIIILIYFWIKRRYNYWNDLGYPQYGPVEFPFGNLRGVATKVHISEVGVNLYEKFKKKAKAVGFFFYFAPVLYVVDLDLIKDILIKDFNTFVNRGTYFNAKSDPLTASMFSVHGDSWRKLRIKMTPAFTSGKMKMMFNTMLGISDDLIKYMQKNVGTIDMKETSARYTTDVIGNVAFGLDLKALDDPESKFREMGKRAFNLSSYDLLKAFVLATNWKFTKNFNFKIISDAVTNFFLDSFKQAVNYREDNNVKRNDLLNILIQLKNKGKIEDDETILGKLSFNELCSQCFLFFTAGFETSSSAITFCLYELAQSQDFQDKLRKEIRDVLENYDGKVTYEAVNEMKYLQMNVDGNI